jgi:uncharacterized protein (TIGR00730 family)
MSPIRSLCVFCGAATGGRPDYASAAFALGRLLAHHEIRLVYGGGRAGLMGAVADACLAAGGSVTGVITTLLKDKELGHTGIQELIVVETMHERKMKMASLADAFIALPGGLGTLDELFEILAWAQLGIHSKPVGLYNAAGFYDGLMIFLDHLDKERFLRLDHRTEVICDADPAALLDRMTALAVSRPNRPAHFPS